MNWLKDCLQVCRTALAVLFVDAAMWLCPENSEERVLLGEYYKRIRGGFQRRKTA